MLIYSDIIFSESYLTLCHVLALGVLLACIYERMIKAPFYTNSVHVTALFTDCFQFIFNVLLLVVTLSSSKHKVVNLSFIGMYLPPAICFTYTIYMFQRQSLTRVVSRNGDPEEFRDTLEAELYICGVMRKLDEAMSREKERDSIYLYSIISRHIEVCRIESCICKNYEPTYHTKFNTEVPG